MAFVLGINAYHGDAAACLIQDGKLIAAAEEERFRRIKHWAGFPSEAIRYCLDEAGIKLDQVDHVAINRDPKANIWKKLSFTLAKRPDFGLVRDRIKNAREWASIEEELGRAFPGERFRGQVHNIEHHMAHLASAFLVSPFEEAVAVSVDGFGDFASAAWGVGRGSEITVEDKVYFPHSLGIFYQALTQYLGFPHYGDEYKVMGLAPYGQPRYMDEMRRIVALQDDGSFRLNLDYFRHHKEKVEYEWENGIPAVGRLFTPALEELLGKARDKSDELTQKHKDIARSVQAMYEEAFFHLLNTLHRRHGLDAVTLAGGCAMNSVANGKVYRNTPFKKVYIQSAAGDAGGAIGAAFVVWHQVSQDPARFVMDHAYWGPQFSDDAVGELVAGKQQALADERCSVERVQDEAELCRRTAQAIAEGKVVGWFQGRMEWGPRALGNRSIVCDPRRADMKDILNLKIKRRESFRPFAPSILREAVPAWFETDDDVPFMMQVYQIREDKRPEIPAVTHVDGSGRLQTVYADTNPRYHRLIKSFEELTGVPIVLNTSFNENEPVVCRPMEALDCFLRTKMDVLVLGDTFISRREAAEGTEPAGSEANADAADGMADTGTYAGGRTRRVVP
ncbi:carbamoyltransferase C-terminal domain-containing protein [Thermithiobacillus tepidarius DSM 3134]|uniref:carbamoyltransferase family protein n=1 Tax=Thermithiobacillus tepidarius TaxID=929 RepID=UPI0004040482|nr:carbamoyltransferase C-terminal domain-containing protein [Thermithiobacillus tepidarius]